MTFMTQEQAVALAKRDDSGDYIARKIRGRWCVWSRAADHVVEFDRLPVEVMR